MKEMKNKWKEYILIIYCTKIKEKSSDPQKPTNTFYNYDWKFIKAVCIIHWRNVAPKTELRSESPASPSYSPSTEAFWMAMNWELTECSYVISIHLQNFCVSDTVYRQKLVAIMWQCKQKVFVKNNVHVWAAVMSSEFSWM